MTAHDHGYQRPFSHPEMIGGLEEAGFCEIRFERVGCIPALAKAMIAVPRRPG
jgi:2-polyprenyl-6-hydroxyphenyl methylase/3-demethylubiquinone-9 3-methyltransferase